MQTAEPHKFNRDKKSIKKKDSAKYIFSRNPLILMDNPKQKN
jgi:hypothetical protein